MPAHRVHLRGERDRLDDQRVAARATLTEDRRHRRRWAVPRPQRQGRRSGCPRSRAVV